MKQKYDVIQKGYNPDYPKEAYIWTQSQPIPEWLSDRAKVSGIDKNGTPILLMRPKTLGGYEIYDSSGDSVLVSLNTDDSWILFSSTHPLISVTPHQLELLYDMYIRD